MSRWLCCLLVLFAPQARAYIHAHIDADGRLQVADEPMPGQRPFDPLRAAPTPAPLRATSLGTAARRAPGLSSLISEAGRQAGVDAALLHAVVQIESGYNPRAVSRMGAAGLMQLMPATARRFGVRDRFDAAQNLQGGARYLAWLIERFEGDLELSLAAYNAGEGAVLRHGNRIPPYAETQAYVRKVLALYQR